MIWGFPKLKEKLATVARKIFAQIHLVYLLHLFLKQAALQTVKALVISEMDYINALYNELPLSTSQKLHLV